MVSITNWSIGKKLLVLIGVGAFFLLTVAGVAIYSAKEIVAEMKIRDSEAELADLANMVAASQGQVASYVAQILMVGEARQDLLDGVMENRAKAIRSFEQLHELERSNDQPESRRLLDRTDEATKEWRASNSKIIELMKTGKRAEAMKAYINENQPLAKKNEELKSAYIKLRQDRLKEINAKTYEQAQSSVKIVSIAALLSLLVSVPLALSIKSSIEKPIELAVAQLEAYSTGDISQDIESGMLVRQDEIGRLAQSMNKMSTSMRRLLTDLSHGIDVVSKASNNLSSQSVQMSAGSRNASEQAQSVAAAAEQMSANVNNVAASMEQTTVSLSQVVESTGQMTDTISEIARNSERARGITLEMERQATEISTEMTGLGNAANSIGKVTETITEIASQTNLLALNATIEAARAGVAGKGFAVVANEIKMLAQQVSSATEDIRAKVSGVQSSTETGIKSIERITGIIREVSETVAAIAAAIEEQSASTKNIAQNISEATSGVKEVNVRMAEASSVTSGITRDVASVETVANEMVTSSEQVKMSASELALVAQELRKTASRFKV